MVSCFDELTKFRVILVKSVLMSMSGSSKFLFSCIVYHCLERIPAITGNPEKDRSSPSLHAVSKSSLTVLSLSLLMSSFFVGCLLLVNFLLIFILVIDLIIIWSGLQLATRINHSGVWESLRGCTQECLCAALCWRMCWRWQAETQSRATEGARH